MADRVKSWDVDDPKTLRRALGANDHFLDDDYYKMFLEGGENAYTSAAPGTLYNSFQTTNLVTGLNKWTAHQWQWKEFWTYGDVTIDSYFLHDNDAATHTVRIGHDMRGLHFANPPAAEINHILLINNTQDVVLTETGDFAQSALVTSSTSSTMTRDSDLPRLVLGLRVTRYGAHANDDCLKSIHYMGTLVTWKPQQRSL